MSKESRRRQRAANPSSPAGASPDVSRDAGPARPGARQESPRAGRRDRDRPLAPASFVERYRSALIGVAVIAVVAIAGFGIFSASTQAAYACSTQWVPGASPAPATGASPQPGYVQPDMGQGHVSNGTALTYTYCPPASGKHFNGTQTGPVSARVYGPTDVVTPQGWIHNLEHGALIVLYRGDSEGATDAGQTALRAFFDSYPPSPVCGFQPGTSVGPVFVRFDDMATPFTAMVWGRVLPLQTLDTAAILELDRTYGERTNPESFCERPSPSGPLASAPAS